MNNRCLFCYNELADEVDFHEGCCRSFFGTPRPPRMDYTLDQMAELAKQVVERSVSVPGFQPKLSMSLVKEIEGRGRFRLTVVGALGGNYIFKPPTREYPELPENEHVTMRMAEAFGIRTVPSSLIRLKSGEISFITRRIDRTTEGKKIHMIDMFQILEAYDKYKGSYEKIGKAIGSYSSNTMLDKLNFLELLVFCFLTANSDMHLKNFSMIEGQSGWVLAPAYDLLNVSLAIPSDQEDVALSLSGKKSKLSRDSFKNLGIGMGLNKKQIEGVFRRFREKKEQSIHLINQSFLSPEMKERYLQTLDERYARAGLFIP